MSNMIINDVYQCNLNRALSFCIVFMEDDAVIYREQNADTGINRILLSSKNGFYKDVTLIERNGKLIVNPCDRCGLHGCDCEVRDYMAETNSRLAEIVETVSSRVDALLKCVDVLEIKIKKLETQRYTVWVEGVPYKIHREDTPS